MKITKAFYILLFLYGSMFGANKLITASKSGNLEAVKQALNEGTNVNEIDNRGYTPLMWAVSFGYNDIVEYLISQRAKLDIQGGGISGLSPLIMASNNGNKEAVMLLVEAEADINFQDKNSGKTALFYAIENGYEDIADYLIDQGADVNIKSSYKQETPLMWAVEANNNYLLKRLIEAGANVDLKNGIRLTALNYAKGYKREGMVNILNLEEALLKKSNIDIVFHIKKLDEDSLFWLSYRGLVNPDIKILLKGNESLLPKAYGEITRFYESLKGGTVSDNEIEKMLIKYSENIIYRVIAVFYNYIMDQQSFKYKSKFYNKVTNDLKKILVLIKTGLAVGPASYVVLGH